MQSIIHHQFGEPVDVLALGDMPQPEPKAGEVRIKTICLLCMSRCLDGAW